MGKRPASVLRTLATAILTTAAMTTAVVMAGAVGVAQAQPTGGPNVGSGSVQTQASYRHGWVQFRGAPLGARGGAKHPAGAHAAGNATSTANDLAYQGGISGVGVTTGAPRVFLVFFGSQWGTQGTNSSGYATFSGDPKGMAPDLQAFFKGLGTGNELWSGVMTQYCQGVAAGTVFCPSGSTHVGYPTGGALAGIWEDTSHASPGFATEAQLGQEAEAAAAHFGNTTAAANRNSQYFIVSPTGDYPDDYIFNGFCAWHDYTGDTSLGSISLSPTNGNPVAFTNLPYLSDVGASCGENFVNSGAAGTLDGATIVGGHEYAETITDQFPAGGWIDSSGEETGDKCAWISSGQGASQDITLTTGTFAVQSTWANDFNGGSGGCEVSHPIVTSAPPNTITVSPVNTQSTNVGTGVSLQMSATDSGSLPVTWSASGLPSGLSINTSSGLVTGTPSKGGTSSVTVTASDSTGGSGSTSFSWWVNAVTVANPGSQTTAPNKAVSLSMSATDTGQAPSLTWSATGLPAGLSIAAATGVISGTTGSAAPASTVTVTATDTGTGASGSTSFSWTVASGPNTVTVTTVGNQSTRRSTSVSLQMHATDSGGLTSFRWSASNLPRGLSINSSTGLISGVPNRTGTSNVTVTATDSTNARGSTSFSWTIHT